MSDTPVRIVRAFFETVDRSLIPVVHVDWEINAAFKVAERSVACVMGVLHLKEGAPVPFTVFVGPKG